MIQKPIEEGVRGLSSVDSLVLNHCGDSMTVVFNTDVDWVIADVPQWLSIVGLQDGGNGVAGATTLKISTKPNLDDSLRVANVYFLDAVDSTLVGRIKVTQDYVIFRWELPEDKDDFSFNWFDSKDNKDKQKEPVIHIISNIRWKLSAKSLITQKDTVSFSFNTGEKWGTAIKDGKDSTDVKVLPSQVNFFAADSVEVRLVPELDTLSAITVKMSQEYLKFLTEWEDGKDPAFTELGYKYAIDGHTKEADFIVECVEPWTVSSCPEWLELYVGGDKLKVGDTNNMVNSQVKIKARITGPNAFDKDLADTIVMRPVHDGTVIKAEEVLRKLNVSQRGFVFEVKNKDKIFNGNENNEYDFPNKEAGETFELSIRTSGTVENNCFISDVPNWMDKTLVHQEEESDKRINAYVLSFKTNVLNTDFSERNEPVFMICPSIFGASVPASFKAGFLFTQEGYIFKVETDGNEPIKEFTPLDTSKQWLSITSTADWKLETTDDWIEFPDSHEGNGDGKASISVIENRDIIKGREGKITFSSHGHDTTFVVTQARYVFDVEKSGETTRFKANDNTKSSSTVNSSDNVCNVSNKGDNWITAEVSEDRKSVSYFVENNTGLYPRSGTVIISDDHGHSAEITVAQSAVLPSPDVGCSARTISSLTFSWDAVSHATGYSLDDGTSVKTLDVTSYTLEGLEQGKEYSVSVTALGDDIDYESSIPGKGARKTLMQLDTPLVNCDTGLSTSSSLTFKWEAVPSALSYNVYVGNSEEPVNVETTQYELAGLEPGNEYSVSVEAVGDVEHYTKSEKSAVATGKTLPAQLAAPSVICDTELSTSSSLTFKWDAVPNALSYNVYVGNSEEPVNVETTQYELTGLEPGNEYSVSVEAVGDVEHYTKSEKSAVATGKTLPAQLAAPSVICDTELSTSSSLTFKWDAVPNALSYNVYVGNSEEPVNVETTQYELTGLEPGNEYSVSVEAVGDGTHYTNSDKSEIVSGTT